MQENQTLRSLLRSVAGFIGEGAGGLLPKLGWEMTDFNNFVNRSETDTAFEGYQQRKKTATGNTNAETGQKRSADNDDVSGLSKKARTNSDASPYSMLLPMSNSPVTAAPLYQPPSSHDGRTMFSDIMRNGNGSPMFIPGSTNANTPPQYGGPSTSNGSAYPSTYIPGGHMNLDPLPPLSFPSSTNTPASRSSDQASPDQVEDDDDPNKNEAYKLIQCVELIHPLNDMLILLLIAIIWTTSRETVPTACLHPCVQLLFNGKDLSIVGIKSTQCLIQDGASRFVFVKFSALPLLTIDLESVIDRILHPELRDRMILLRSTSFSCSVPPSRLNNNNFEARFDLVDCLLEYRNAVTIHGDDVLAHSNWEINEKWLRKYG